MKQNDMLLIGAAAVAAYFIFIKPKSPTPLVAPVLLPGQAPGTVLIPGSSTSSLITASAAPISSIISTLFGNGASPSGYNAANSQDANNYFNNLFPVGGGGANPPVFVAPAGGGGAFSTSFTPTPATPTSASDVASFYQNAGKQLPSGSGGAAPATGDSWGDSPYYSPENEQLFQQGMLMSGMGCI